MSQLPNLVPLAEFFDQVLTPTVELVTAQIFQMKQTSLRSQGSLLAANPKPQLTSLKMCKVGFNNWLQGLQEMWCPQASSTIDCKDCTKWDAHRLQQLIARIARNVMPIQLCSTCRMTTGEASSRTSFRWWGLRLVSSVWPTTSWR